MARRFFHADDLVAPLFQFQAQIHPLSASLLKGDGKTLWTKRDFCFSKILECAVITYIYISRGTRQRAVLTDRNSSLRALTVKVIILYTKGNICASVVETTARLQRSRAWNNELINTEPLFTQRYVAREIIHSEHNLSSSLGFYTAATLARKRGSKCNYSIADRNLCRPSNFIEDRILCARGARLIYAWMRWIAPLREMMDITNVHMQFMRCRCTKIPSNEKHPREVFVPDFNGTCREARINSNFEGFFSSPTSFETLFKTRSKLQKTVFSC